MITRKQYWYNIMKLENYSKNIEEIELSSQIKEKNNCDINKDVITVVGTVKQVRFNNNVYAKLIPTKEELNQLYLLSKEYDINNVISSIDDDFNNLNQEKINYTEQLKIIKQLPESLVSSNNKSCIKNYNNEKKCYIENNYVDNSKIRKKQFQFQDNILDYIK